MTNTNEAAGGARPGGFVYALLQRLSDVRPIRIETASRFDCAVYA